MERTCNRNRNRHTLRGSLIFAASMVFASGVSAQATRTCSADDMVGWIGIAGLECTNCQMSADNLRFSTEPRITSVAPNSVGEGQLRPGDVILSINGSLITTPEGGDKLANLRPGQRVSMMIRRDGSMLMRSFDDIPGRCGNTVGLTALGRGGAGAGGTMIFRGRDTLMATQSPTARARQGTAAVYSPSARGTMTRTPLAIEAARAGFRNFPPPGFGFGISCSDCMVHMQRPVQGADEPLVWEFRSPPEIYSVETNTAAWRAGLRRGDVITHIDGINITSDNGGRKFGSVRPGQLVQLRLRRDGAARTVSIRAEAARATSQEPLRNARVIVEEMEKRDREQRVLIDRLLEATRDNEDQAARELRERLTREQSEQNRTLTELTTQLARAERARVETAVAAGGIRERTMAPSIATVTPSPRTIRYSGRIGNTDIEVRGSSAVIVQETEDEVIIQIGENTIRLKKR